MPPNISNMSGADTVMAHSNCAHAKPKNFASPTAESSTRGAKCFTKTEVKSAAGLLKPGFARRFMTFLSRSKEQPAPAPPSAFGAKLAAELQKNRTILETWRALQTASLPKSYSADEIAHPSYDFFKKSLCAAASLGKETLDDELEKLPALSPEERLAISDTFLNDLADGIGFKFDASYKAVRENMASALSPLTLPEVLMMAVQPTLKKALDATSAKFVDGSFVRMASNFTIDISDIKIQDPPTPSMASRLPLKFSLAIKADRSTLDTQNPQNPQNPQDPKDPVDAVDAESEVAALSESPLIDTAVTTVAIYRAPFSAADFLSKNDIEVSEVFLPAIPVAMATAGKTNANTLDPVISKDSKAPGRLKKMGSALGLTKVFTTFDNPKYVHATATMLPASPVPAATSPHSVESAELAEHLESMLEEWKEESTKLADAAGAEPVASVAPVEWKNLVSAESTELTGWANPADWTNSAASEKPAQNPPITSMRRSKSRSSRTTTWYAAPKPEEISTISPESRQLSMPKSKGISATGRAKWHDPMGELKAGDRRVAAEMDSSAYKDTYKKIEMAWNMAASKCKDLHSSENVKVAREIPFDLDNMEIIYKNAYGYAYVYARLHEEMSVTASMLSAHGSALLKVRNYCEENKRNSDAYGTAMAAFDSLALKTITAQKPSFEDSGESSGYESGDSSSGSPDMQLDGASVGVKDKALASKKPNGLQRMMNAFKKNKPEHKLIRKEGPQPAEFNQTTRL